MLIGLCGAAGSGKDSVARFLAPVHLVEIKGQEIDVRKYAPQAADSFAALLPHAVQSAFADPMKAYCMDIFGWDFQRLWGPSSARNTPDTKYRRDDPRIDEYLSPRETLQTLGTEWGRQCHPNTWVDYWLRRAQKLTAEVRVEKPTEAHTFVASWTLKRCEHVVASDVRFPNEISAIRAAGGEVWRIERPGANGLTGAAAAHASEHSLDEAVVDRTIVNDGTLSDLYAKVKAIVVG